MRLRLRQTTALSKTAVYRCRIALCRYARDESGVLIKPTLAIFLSMLAVGGVGVDLMRMERDRTELQYTLDRAVLAAADLDQPLSPAAVVMDYLSKAGLSEYYQAPYEDPDNGFGYRKVSSTVNTDFETHYMNLTGVSSIPIYASSTAEESIDGLEISLVLDVSGSMRSNSRLTNLKVAAKEFITTMVANTTPGKMSISIVPYATQVSGTDKLFEQFTLTDDNDYSNCINFTDDDFRTTSLSTEIRHERTMHFSPWTSRDGRTYYSTPSLVSSPVCVADDDREMLLFEQDEATLKNFINNLVATGNTSIDIGMKWGSALLDRSTQPAIEKLTQGVGATISADFADRPSRYDDPDTLKVVVLMTDGQNTSQYFIEPEHRSGDSGIWYNATAKRYSSFYQYYDDKYGVGYYWDDPGYDYRSSNWRSHPYGDHETGDAVRLSQAELWAYTGLKYVYKYIYNDWMHSDDAKAEWYYGVYDYVRSSEKNTRTKAICDSAKAQGIIVYTIGFEAPSSGRAVLKDCASSDAHFFDVDGLEISEAFASIATSIRQLRLTQ
ncbi:hypothetical protein DL239_19245 [Sedimentitalea sp. CY04]|uniref:Putative Flp pilus-assembly TadG-like N-terminal domain-containing protein n=1 Tax=Parasedimentitalea denitrificans TaxID=2211118 RepID=A0ABX0WBS2_9RHOB|nr:pilus assembly protein TadG-related protein [Sedimentitalea sp. CY04]NIZ63104.1 hypothetical protein [Sedimentitalea sp. CY04]